MREYVVNFVETEKFQLLRLPSCYLVGNWFLDITI